MHVLPYLVEDKAPWPPGQIEALIDPNVSDPLRQFKEDLRKYVVGFFSDPPSLRGKISRNLLEAIVADKLSVTRAAMKQFLTILDKKEAPISEWDKLLQEIAASYKSFQAKLQPVTSSDPWIHRLKQEAQTEWQAGNSEQAEQSLNQATEFCLEKLTQFKLEAQEFERLAQNRRETITAYQLEAATSQGAIGDLLMTQLHYLEAAKYFSKAADLVPLEESKLRADFLDMWGVAAWHAGDYRAAVTPFEQALAIRHETQSADDPALASTMGNLAAIYDELGRYDAAERLYRDALSIHEHTLGTDSLVTVGTANNLALFLADHNLYKSRPHLTDNEPSPGLRY